VVEAVAGEPARLEVLDQDVGAPGQLAGHLGVGLVAQVERDGALPAVDPEVVGGDTLALRWGPGARVVARGALDLDHVGAHVGQQHRGVRAGQDAGEVRDQEPGQRSRRGLGHPLAFRPHHGRLSGAAAILLRFEERRQGVGALAP
jgi:hypothetical protein